MKYYAPTKLSENIRKTPEGFLLCIGVSIGRVGEMIYAAQETPLEAGADGMVRVSRDADQLFRPATMASFEGKAFTISHPEEFVTPENWSELAKGVLQGVRKGVGEQEGDLVADILVTDAEAIALVEKGLREVSCGYEAEYTQVEPGKGVQTNIIGNHLALVEEGRAGAAYAINDHKAKGVKKMSKFDKIKALFAKAADEAAKVVDEGAEEKVEAKADDAAAYDAMMAACKDLNEKVEAYAKQKAAKDEAKVPEKKEEEKAKDEEKVEEKKEEGKDEEVAASLEDRLKALEDKVAALLEDESEEDSEEVGDEEEMEEESADEDMEEIVETGDTAERAEILAPGIAITKDVKKAALKTAYGTADGKKMIDVLTGGKAPAFDSADAVNALFIASSELLKNSRSQELSKTKKTRDFQSALGNPEGAMTAEKMNEINAKHFASRK